MKKITGIFASIMAAAGCLCSCDSRSSGDTDDSPVTIFISIGPGREYMDILSEGVKNKYGIDIQYLDCYSSDRTRQVELELQNGRMPADIVVSDKKVPYSYLEPICLNLLSYSHISNAFDYGTIKACSTENGAVYELPIASKLIGITYNETVLKENGWELPKNFRDMLELKRKCDHSGIPFSVTEITYSGNGFNYLFHLMGAQWISTIDGGSWFEGFLSGTQTIGPFKEKSGYFKKWVDNGLFGEIRANDAYKRFLSSRALFYFSSLNRQNSGNGDVLKAMPWISENGSSNCFTRFDNRWIMVDGRLQSKDKQEKLRKVCKVLDYLTDKEFVDAVKDLFPDNYLALNDYVPGEHQLYSEYASHIKAGFVQHWYYERFSGDVIVPTGSEINSYLLNNFYGKAVPQYIFDNSYFAYAPDADFDSVMKVLEEEEEEEEARRQVPDDGILFTALEEIDCEHTAKISAISGAMALQERLAPAKDGPSEVNVALMPYTKTFNDVHPWLMVGYSTACIHKGHFKKSDRFVLNPNPARTVYGIRMTGAEIKDIISAGFDPSGFFMDSSSGKSKFDVEHYGPYQYACTVKGGGELKDDREYLVAVSRHSLAPDIFKNFHDSGKVMKSQENGEDVECEISEGFQLFFDKHKNLTQNDIVW